jgi:subtilisin family serine protease
MTIGNITIAKIDNCNQTALDKLGNFTKLNLGSDINVTKQQLVIPFNATTNNSLNSSNAFPSSGLNTTWDENLPNNIRALTNNTINMIIDNLTKQTEEDSTLIKQTLSNVTFYQFTPLDITRTLFNETINNLVELNKTSTSSVLNQTSKVIDQNEINKTGSLLPTSSDSEPIDIVIVDTGVSLTHPDLSVYRSMSFVNGNLSSHSDLTDDKNGHGSHIAGIINAKDNGFGIVGIVPEDNIRIWSMKVCSDDGICSLSDQIKAIEYITKNSDLIDIVNYSIENPYSKLFEQAISESVKAGITYVVAAGNFAQNATLTTSPASNPDVITVSAIGDSDGKCGGLGPLLDAGRMMDDTFANFSNFGPSIDVAAPGVDILSTFNGSDYGILSGTSMAVPHVTGLAAYLKTIHPDANPDTIREMIAKSGSAPDSECQENKGIGYFKGDVDRFAEPLIVLPKEIIRDDVLIRVDATNTDKDSKTNATKQELPTTKAPATETNATKQELPTTKAPATETNATKEELPTTKAPAEATTKKLQQPPIVENQTKYINLDTNSIIKEYL